MKLRRKIVIGAIISYLFFGVASLIIGLKIFSDSKNDLFYSSDPIIEDVRFHETQDRLYSNAQIISDRLDYFYDDVRFLQNFYVEGLLNNNVTSLASGLNFYEDKVAADWPQYGFVHPLYGVYADFELLSDGSPWLPKRVVDQAKIDSDYLKNISNSLDRAVSMTPIFASIYSKYNNGNNIIDLVWIVLDDGVSNVYPPYDYLSIISKNPDIVDLNESENDYIRLLNPENNPNRQILWLDPYFDEFREEWMVSAVAPLYSDNQFLGSVGIDLLLSTIFSEFNKPEFNKGDYSFLLDRNGFPMAMPASAIDDLILDKSAKLALQEVLKPNTEQVWSDELRKSLNQSFEEITIDPLASILQEGSFQNNSVNKIVINGEEKVVSLVSMPDLNWTLVTVLPYEVVTETSERYSLVISSFFTEITGNFWLVLVFGFLFVLAISFLGYRMFVDPIIYLIDDLEKAPNGELSDIINNPSLITRDDEIGVLSRKIKSTAKELKESKDNYSNLVERSNDGIVVIKDDSILFANTQMMNLLGHTPSDCVGAKFSHCVASGDKDNISRMLSKNNGSRFECNLLNVNRREIPVEINSSPVIFSGKRATLMMVRDMTKFKDAEKLRADFVSMASHQMRTPLTGVKWFAELLLRGKAGKLSIKQKDYLEQISISNEKMIELIEDMLSVSRIESSERFKIESKLENVVEIFRQVIKDQTAILNIRNISIENDRNCPKSLLANVDKNKLYLILQNVIENAVKYSKNGDKIIFNIHVADDQVIFSVIDHGVGIPKYQQGKVFDRFFRADNISSTHPGTGLGLYIAKFLVEKQNGKIWFVSTEGKGSTFYISLPLVKGKA